MRFSLLLRTGCLGVIACTMTGCIAPLVVGGAAITTATVVTDRRSPGSIVSDEVLEKRVSYEIAKSLGEVDSHITVTSYSGRVLLTGEVPNAQIQARVRQVAAGSLDVVAVVDELAVMPVSSMSSRLSDSLLATKVRTALIGNGKVSLNQMRLCPNEASCTSWASLQKMSHRRQFGLLLVFLAFRKLCRASKWSLQQKLPRE